uniref:SAP domain-containing protein n=1 Tax=Octopus bimaculoides TaxID=37653 RepID=A0A0L8I359_OCTBM
MDIKQLDDSAIEVLTVPELKKYLRLYGQYVTGRKADLTERHVHSIEYHNVSESCSHCIVRCLVIPSILTSNQKKNPDHRVWVIMSNVTGNVHSADCNC